MKPRIFQFGIFSSSILGDKKIFQPSIVNSSVGLLILDYQRFWGALIRLNSYARPFLDKNKKRCQNRAIKKWSISKTFPL